MESFEAVYEELFPQVYRYLLVLCGDRDLAEGRVKIFSHFSLQALA